MRADLQKFKKRILLFGAKDSQICKNECASRLAEIKNAHSVSLVQNLSQVFCDGLHPEFIFYGVVMNLEEPLATQSNPD